MVVKLPSMKCHKHYLSGPHCFIRKCRGTDGHSDFNKALCRAAKTLQIRAETHT
jgi:hypothetical protein